MPRHTGRLQSQPTGATQREPLAPGGFIVSEGWGGPDIALDVWVTKEQEEWNAERVLHILLLFHNPDAQSSVWATLRSNTC